MRKITTLILIVLAGLVVVGCSLPSIKSSSKKSSVKTFTFSNSIWKSTDGGVTWEAKNKGEGDSNTTDADVLSFAVNPVDSNIVYAGLKKGGIMKTENGGETWKFVNFQSEKVYGLALSPIDGKILYASGVWQGTGKIFKSEDGGNNWKEIYTSPSSGPLVISLTIDKKNPSVIYATTSANEAIKSVDGGASWKNIYLADAPILKISVDAADSNLIYCITNEGEIFRSIDGGGSFENIEKKISDSLVDAIGGRGFSLLKTDPTHSKYVYLAGEEGIVLSQNAGEAWKKIYSLNDPKNFPIKDIAISPTDSKNLVYASNQAAYKSIDGGINWTTFQFESQKLARVLMFNPQDPNIVYLGFLKQ
jgi:photosystem II stability/assembly factor-like uncharacterized protein